MDYAARARALVGVRFRPQGRDPSYGLDCVGLALAAFAIPPGAVRRNYRLRGNHGDEIVRSLEHWFRRVGTGQRRPGSLLLLRVSPEQFHFAVTTSVGFVHADARLNCVVETPGQPAWPIIRAYRRRADTKR